MMKYLIKIEKYYDLMYFYIKEKMNHILKKISSLFNICLKIQEPPSPLPYRRKLPNSRSVYKTISFNEKHRGIII